jgi:hypothetical protein
MSLERPRSLELQQLVGAQLRVSREARAKAFWTTSCAAPSSLVTPWGAALVYGVRDAVSPGTDRVRQSFLYVARKVAAVLGAGVA